MKFERVPHASLACCRRRPGHGFRLTLTNKRDDFLSYRFSSVFDGMPHTARGTRALRNPIASFRLTSSLPPLLPEFPRPPRLGSKTMKFAYPIECQNAKCPAWKGGRGHARNLLDRGGKRSAMPLSHARKSCRRCALPARSMTPNSLSRWFSILVNQADKHAMKRIRDT